MKRALCLFFVLAVLAAPAGAVVPQLISYQGHLTDTNGNPLSGTHSLTFRIYGGPGGPSPLPLWTETHAAVAVDDGFFNVILGSITPFPTWLFQAQELLLGITVDTEAELTPRMRLTASPFALRAAWADSAVVSTTINPDYDWIISTFNMYSGVIGNVGIGCVSPEQKLHVGDEGVANSQGMIRLESRSGTQGSHRTWDVGVPETDGDSGGKGYSFCIDDVDLGTDPEFMVKWGTGYVGIGTIQPDAHLTVVKPAASTAESAMRLTTVSDGGPFTISTTLRFDGTGINAESSLGTATIHLNNNETGNVTLANGGGKVGIGTSNPQSKLDVAGTARVQVVEITGADVAERFPMSEPAEPGAVVAIDPGNPGTLMLCREAYSRRVAGVVSGANDLPTGAILGNLPGAERTAPVALSGRVWVRCDADAGRIEPGDLLTTSDVAGHAMKVTDHGRAQGAILGKAMTGLGTGRGMVLVLVTLQ